MFTNLYLVERCCGGPEEGGWYFEHFEFIRGGLSTPARQAKLRAFAAEENQGRRPLHHVLSDGLYVVIDEPMPGYTRPTTAPVYE